MANKKAIAARNDEFRKAVINSPIRQIANGKVFLTAGVAGLDILTCAKVLASVRGFSDFTPDNTPYGENDFGFVTVNGIKYFFKIDYFANDKLDCGTDDPLTAYLVLTIMEASEY